MGFLARLPIRLRVTLAFAVAMAVVLAATGVFLYLRLGSALDRTIDQSLRARATDVGALVRRGDSAGKEGEGITQVLDPSGAVLAATPGLGRPLLTTEEISRARRGPLSVERPIPNSDESARILATPLDTQRGPRIVVVGSSLEQRGDALENLFVALLIGGPLALLLASLAGYGLAAAALRPVESMRREAEAVSAAEPGRRLPLPPAQDEISRLGETLNVMLGRLESALARERRFVSDASHELRTPLSALRTELELALGAKRRERRPELVTRVGDEAPLACQRRLQAAEHDVEGLAETGDLVLRWRKGKPPSWLRGGDRFRLAPHRLDRAESGRGEPVAGQRSEEQCERAADEQRHEQVLQRISSLLQRRSDDDDSLSALRVEGRGEDAGGLVGIGDRALDRHRLSARPRDLFGGQERTAKPRCGGQHCAAGIEHLRHPFSFLAEGVPLADQSAYVGRARAKALVDRAVQG